MLLPIKDLMKQQHLLILAMAILVLYSLVFPQKELYQTLSSADCSRTVNENGKQNQIASSNVDGIKSQIMQIKSCLWKDLEFNSNSFIQDEDHNLTFPDYAFKIPKAVFGMGTLQI